MWPCPTSPFRTDLTPPKVGLGLPVMSDYLLLKDECRMALLPDDSIECDPLQCADVFDFLYFTGEATSSDAYASVHGACISGRDAARAAI